MAEKFPIVVVVVVVVVYDVLSPHMGKTIQKHSASFLDSFQSCANIGPRTDIGHRTKEVLYVSRRT